MVFQPGIVDKMATFLAINLNFLTSIYKVVKIIPFEYMAIGAIGGYFYKNYSNKIVFYTKSKFIYIAIMASIFILMFFSIIPIYLQSVVLSIFFLFLIITSINDDNTLVFRNKYLSYIGTISYGVYMYHPFFLFLVFPFVNEYFPAGDNLLYYNVLVYLFVFGLTILLSHLSYKYFELRFIKIKDTKYKTL